MGPTLWRQIRRRWRQLTRRALAGLPQALRFGLYRNMVECEPVSRPGLVLKIAQTQEELEACFALLHDAYVSNGFMQPHPSGLRVTPYHALPTTTTLCAKLDGQVVGTLSIVREGVFGFPMQTAFDISSVRAKPGRIAEISALAVHPRYRKTGGTILFPLMKFMYEYCTRYFDTRHLLIAVNPNMINLYESLLFFQRLQAQTVDRYDFANGAPAVGATLDLHLAPGIFEKAYAHKSGRKNLYRYFVQTQLEAIQFPDRDWHTSNDPVLTPALIDHFFNQRVPVLEGLDERRRLLLHSIYPDPVWQAVLPRRAGETAASEAGLLLRQSPRYTWMCEARLLLSDSPKTPTQATIVEISRSGFLARVPAPLPLGATCEVHAELGKDMPARLIAQVVRRVKSASATLFGFQIKQPDATWLQCVAWQEQQMLAHAGAARLSGDG